MNDFAIRLKYLREINNLSQRELARRADIVRSCISKMEQGHIMPSAANLVKLADFFRVSVDWMLSREPMLKSTLSELVYELSPEYSSNRDSQFNTPTITNDEIQLLKDFRKLTPSQQKEVLSYIQFKSNIC